LIALYLLLLSSVTVNLSSPSVKPFDFFHYLSIIQNYTFFAFILILLVKAETFGNAPECNGNAVLVIFQPFRVIPAGRLVGSIATGIVILLYTWITVRDHLPESIKEKSPWSRNTDRLPAKPDLNPPARKEDLESGKKTRKNTTDYIVRRDKVFDRIAHLFS
jgi:hypothetical protein